MKSDGGVYLIPGQNRDVQHSENKTVGDIVSIAIGHFYVRVSRNIISSLLITAGLLSVVRIALFGLYSSQIREQPYNSKILKHQNPLIYHDLQDVPHFISSGPHDVNPGIPGMYEFHNVCLTRHFEDESLLGLVYFVPPSDANVHNNPSRCVPCELFLFHGWDDIGEGEHLVRHKCGFHNVHAMYATDVSDWSACMKDKKNGKFFRRWWGEDHFLPSSVDEVHLYKEPMIALSHNMNIGHSLFDHLLTYVPHWFTFRHQNKFPFSAVASLTIDQCLNDSKSHWYCELLRAMDAFGGAHEVSVLPKKGSTTLNCYEKLYIVHLALPRINDYEAETMPSKEVFDEFRQVLFEEFELPRDKAFRYSQRERRALSHILPKKVLFYAHEPSGRRVWSNMNDLLSNVKRQSRYKEWEFDTVYDFGALSIQEQAHLFNVYDVMIMVHGAQMANSIFAVDGTLFVEVGCDIPEFLGKETFLSLIGGRYAKVESCDNSDPNSICVECGQEE